MGAVILPPDVRDYLHQLETRISELERRAAGPTVYTLASRPTAVDVRPAAIIFVSDAVDGQRFQGSDGSNWKTLG